MKRITLYLLLTTTYLLFTMMHCDDGPMPVLLTRIELANFNNAGKEMTLAETSLLKEAYVMGITCFYKTGDDSNYEGKISLNDESWDQRTLRNVESVSVVCNSTFSEAYPLGSDITSLFTKSEKLLLKEGSGAYSYFLVLTKAPDVGTHSFRVIYKLKGSEGTIACDTQPIEFL